MFALQSDRLIDGYLIKLAFDSLVITYLVFTCVGFSGNGFPVDGLSVIGFPDNGFPNNGTPVDCLSTLLWIPHFTVRIKVDFGAKNPLQATKKHNAYS